MKPNLDEDILDSPLHENVVKTGREANWIAVSLSIILYTLYIATKWLVVEFLSISNRPTYIFLITLVIFEIAIWLVILRRLKIINTVNQSLISSFLCSIFSHLFVLILGAPHFNNLFNGVSDPFLRYFSIIVMSLIFALPITVVGTSLSEWYLDEEEEPF